MNYKFRSFHLFRDNLRPSISIIIAQGELDMKVTISEETRDKILRLLETHIDEELGIPSRHFDSTGKIVSIKND